MRMRLSKALIPSRPGLSSAEDTVVGDSALLRAGFAGRLEGGTWYWSAVGTRSLRKLEGAIRDHLSRVPCQELRLPLATIESVASQGTPLTETPPDNYESSLLSMLVNSVAGSLRSHHNLPQYFMAFADRATRSPAEVTHDCRIWQISLDPSMSSRFRTLQQEFVGLFEEVGLPVVWQVESGTNRTIASNQTSKARFELASWQTYGQSSPIATHFAVDGPLGQPVRPFIDSWTIQLDRILAAQLTTIMSEDGQPLLAGGLAAFDALVVPRSADESTIRSVEESLQEHHHSNLDFLVDDMESLDGEAAPRRTFGIPFLLSSRSSGWELRDRRKGTAEQGTLESLLAQLMHRCETTANA